MNNKADFFFLVKSVSFFHLAELSDCEKMYKRRCEWREYLL